MFKKKLSLQQKKEIMSKLKRTFVVYLSGTVLQIVSFLLSKNNVEAYNKLVEQHNASIPSLTWWQKIVGKKTVPEQTVFDSSLGWFTIDKWGDFDIKYYDITELISFIALFTITAFAYYYLSGENIRKYHTGLRAISFILSLLSGYVILYEVIAIVK